MVEHFLSLYHLVKFIFRNFCLGSWFTFRTISIVA